MNGHKEMCLSPLEELDLQLENLRAFLWLLYLAVKDDDNAYVPAIDGILELANNADATLQRCIEEQMKEARHVEV